MLNWIWTMWGRKKGCESKAGTTWMLCLWTKEEIGIFIIIQPKPKKYKMFTHSSNNNNKTKAIRAASSLTFCSYFHYVSLKFPANWYSWHWTTHVVGPCNKRQETLLLIILNWLTITSNTWLNLSDFHNQKIVYLFEVFFNRRVITFLLITHNFMKHTLSR